MVVMTGAEPGHGPAMPVWRRRRRVAGLAMLIAAPLALVAYPLGGRLADGTRLVVLLRAFDGPVPYVVAAAVLLIAGAALRPLKPILFALALTVGLIALFGCLAFGAIFQGWEEGRTVHAPGGADRRAVIWHGGSLDPIYRVTVVQGTGLGAREWEAACLSGDDSGHALKGVTWATPARLLVTDADGGEYVVGLDPDSGRPLNSPIMNC